ncbi:putative mitogen-activated protein kinase kinase kinase 7-like [Drosophila sulfurigaster albostrigata]|uniref:putative mitogen-activated protein kinase kinase kinase 7-like n=1 Tax=Drosophila sulfurigaster albostrigata TaxID=89887 RepID=UPI002D21E919|nr:putative mitogen-activated protein kinase kinase kinase 7-like [Drosophila sulfurigaster albostrigata]
MDNTDINVNFKDIKLLEWIGRGSFGEVRKGIWRIHGQETDIAVKITTYNEKETIKKVHREVENLRKCIHPNIIKLYGVSKSRDNRDCLILEYADCGSLYEFLHCTKREASFNEKIDWMLQCAKGIEYLHTKNIAHRDLKTQNLLLFNEYRTLKICDFGTVKELVTNNTQDVGTVCYMAPEVYVEL